MSSLPLFSAGPTPMMAVPTKQTSDIDWAGPIKQHIRDSNMADPDAFSDECNQLNRLRVDMHGATTTRSVNSRDLLYRYYGQLELLDLRFPIDETHVRITFTWNDAFTNAPTTQYSLAFEKASILFNIGAVISAGASGCDRRIDDQLKLAYHSFKSAAGVFTYINQNFLHAPSFDLQTSSIDSLTRLMLAQAQEVFFERLMVGYVGDQSSQQATDSSSGSADKPGTKPSMLAKLAIEAANQYSSLVDSLKTVEYYSALEKGWPSLIQTKAHYMKAMAHYFHAIVDRFDDRHGAVVARLQAAEKCVNLAVKAAESIPADSASGTVTADAGPSMRRILEGLRRSITERLAEATRDNDFIFHNLVPDLDALAAIQPLVGAHPTPVSELYKGRDVQDVIGPDIFRKFVPITITEAVSRYDEEKAKLVRSEAEAINGQVSKMRVTLDRLKLPDSLDLLVGNVSHQTIIPENFIGWCEQMHQAAPLDERFNRLENDKSAIDRNISEGTKSLNREETFCEMMRKKYGELWTQEESKELTSSFRIDIENYQKALREASESDRHLRRIFDKYRPDFVAMRDAGQLGEAEVLFQQAMLESGSRRSKNSTPIDVPEADLLVADLDSRPSIDDQVCEIRAKLVELEEVSESRLVVLDKLREKVRKDDISHILMRTVRASSADEAGLFKKQLEKFWSFRAQIGEANTKQASVLAGLVQMYEVLLLDDRIKARQREHETLIRRSKDATTRFSAVNQAFADLNTGLDRAAAFYAEMGSSVDDLISGIRRFVETRRAEGSQMLSHIEIVRSRKGSASSTAPNSGANSSRSTTIPMGAAAMPTPASSSADADGRMLQELMDRMAIGPAAASPGQKQARPVPPPVMTGGRSSHHHQPQQHHSQPPVQHSQQYSQQYPQQHSQHQQHQQHPQHPQHQQHTQQHSQVQTLQHHPSAAAIASIYGPVPSSPPPNQTLYGQIQPPSTSAMGFYPNRPPPGSSLAGNQSPDRPKSTNTYDPYVYASMAVNNKPIGLPGQTGSTYILPQAPSMISSPLGVGNPQLGHSDRIGSVPAGGSRVASPSWQTRPPPPPGPYPSTGATTGPGRGW